MFRNQTTIWNTRRVILKQTESVDVSDSGETIDTTRHPQNYLYENDNITKWKRGFAPS
jgi:hypothetical protein